MARASRELIVYSRRQCGLCEDLLARLEPLAERLDARVTIRDVDESVDRKRRFGLKVPVVTDSDGSVLCWGHLDEDAVRAGIESS